MSTTYKATAHREGDWWVIDVDGIGATQTKRLDQADGTARDLIATMLDVDPAVVQVDITPEVGPELDGLVLSARTAADAAKKAQAKAAETSRATAERLHEAGYSMRDIGVLTGVSYQRVHQLLAEIKTQWPDGDHVERVSHVESSHVEPVKNGRLSEAKSVRSPQVRTTSTRSAISGKYTTSNAASGRKASSKGAQQAPVDA